MEGLGKFTVRLSDDSHCPVWPSNQDLTGKPWFFREQLIQKAKKKFLQGRKISKTNKILISLNVLCNILDGISQMLLLLKHSKIWTKGICLLCVHCERIRIYKRTSVSPKKVKISFFRKICIEILYQNKQTCFIFISYWNNIWILKINIKFLK